MIVRPLTVRRSTALAVAVSAGVAVTLSAGVSHASGGRRTEVIHLFSKSAKLHVLRLTARSSSTRPRSPTPATMSMPRASTTSAARLTMRRSGPTPTTRSASSPAPRRHLLRPDRHWRVDDPRPWRSEPVTQRQADGLGGSGIYEGATGTADAVDLHPTARRARASSRHPAPASKVTLGLWLSRSMSRRACRRTARAVTPVPFGGISS